MTQVRSSEWHLSVADRHRGCWICSPRPTPDSAKRQCSNNQTVRNSFGEPFIFLRSDYMMSWLFSGLIKHTHLPCCPLPRPTLPLCCEVFSNLEESGSNLTKNCLLHFSHRQAWSYCQDASFVKPSHFSPLSSLREERT